jgi:hypothetical protein
MPATSRARHVRIAFHLPVLNGRAIRRTASVPFRQYQGIMALTSLQQAVERKLDGRRLGAG